MLLFLQIHSSFSVSRFPFFREKKGIFSPSFRPHWKKNSNSPPPPFSPVYLHFLPTEATLARIWEMKNNALAATAKKIVGTSFSFFSFHEWRNLCFISFSSPVRNDTLRSYLHNLLREKEGWCRSKRKMAQDASNEEKGGKATVSMKEKKSFFVFLCGKKGLPSLPPQKKEFSGDYSSSPYKSTEVSIVYLLPLPAYSSLSCTKCVCSRRGCPAA